MKDKFYGWEAEEIFAITEEYPGIRTHRDLYEALLEVWCAQTCAPRMRKGWSRENASLGQCSVTAFLAQDIFGGSVYGIPRPQGGVHCYNVAGGQIFDLTSDQFVKAGEWPLNYENNPLQHREEHFSKEEKRLRYELLKGLLKERLIGKIPDEHS